MFHGIVNFLGIPLYLKRYPHSFMSGHQDLGRSFHDLTTLSLLTSSKPWPNTASGSSSNQTFCGVASASEGLGVWSEKQSHRQPYIDLLLEGKSFGVHTFRHAISWDLTGSRHFFFCFPDIKYTWASVLKALISLTTRLSLSATLSVHIYSKTLVPPEDQTAV